MAVRIDNLTVDELARVEKSELDVERGLFRRIVTAFDEVSGAKDRGDRRASLSAVCRTLLGVRGGGLGV
ncbi:MAG: hypothetical protein L6W00_27640 [Lentisphaeria bacterium]|nr:MAG: hypothetical protein L6W00_27640 [Lentisphaeria bacterium]